MSDRPTDPIPDSWEQQTRIPLAIRERVWGGEGVLSASERSPRREGTRLDLLANLRRLRRSERSRGTVYGGADEPHPTDDNRTRRISPLRASQRLRDWEG